jgi:hypothetical protein
MIIQDCRAADQKHTQQNWQINNTEQANQQHDLE